MKGKIRNFAVGFRSRCRDDEVRVTAADECKTLSIN